VPNHYARLARAAHRRIHGPVGAGHRVVAILVGATLGLTAGSLVPVADLPVQQEQRLKVVPLAAAPPWARDEVPASASKQQIPGCHSRMVVSGGELREVWIDHFGLPCDTEEWRP
jgi:hypothetical protein